MVVAANLASSTRVAAEYSSLGYSSPGQLQLPAAGPITTTTSVSALAVGDLWACRCEYRKYGCDLFQECWD